MAKYDSKVPQSVQTFARKYKLKAKAYKQYYSGAETTLYKYVLIMDYQGNTQRAIADIKENRGWFGDRTFTLDRLYLEGMPYDEIFWQSELKEFKTLKEVLKYMSQDKYFLIRVNRR